MRGCCSPYATNAGKSGQSVRCYCNRDGRARRCASSRRDGELQNRRSNGRLAPWRGRWTAPLSERYEHHSLHGDKALRPIA